MKILFDVSLFSRQAVRVGQIEGLGRKNSEWALLILLGALVKINRRVIRKAKLPPLYKAGVRYVREQGTENWQDALKTYRRGIGDCEDLACWRVAELLNNGKDARPFIRWRLDPATKTYIYHVMVMRANGQIEDPSRVLGMS